MSCDLLTPRHYSNVASIIVRDGANDEAVVTVMGVGGNRSLRTTEVGLLSAIRGSTRVTPTWAAPVVQHFLRSISSHRGDRGDGVRRAGRCPAIQRSSDPAIQRSEHHLYSPKAMRRPARLGTRGIPHHGCGSLHRYDAQDKTGWHLVSPPPEEPNPWIPELPYDRL